MRRLLWTGVGLAAAGAAGLAWGEARWRSTSNRLTADLLAPTRDEPSTVDLTRDVAGLAVWYNFVK